MDQELSELKRRWTTSGQAEDRGRYVQAAARVEGRSPGWISYRLELESFSPDHLRDRVRVLYQRKAGVSGRQALAASVNRVVRECTGTWFEGLSEDWSPAWCSCHCLPKGPRDVGQAVARVLAQVQVVHEFKRDLVELGEADPQESDPLSEARALGGEVLESLVKATGCNETWYHEVTPALEFVLRGRGLEGLDFEPLSQLVHTSFSSWTRPTTAAREAALDLYALSAAAAGLEGRS